MESDLALAGTGKRAHQLSVLSPEIRWVYERLHADECEERVQAAGPHSGKRMVKAIPPYLKWPIYQTRPRRPDGCPGSLKELGTGVVASGAFVVPRRVFNFQRIPRIVGEVSYLNGELGMLDRRVAAALCENASQRGRWFDSSVFAAEQSWVLDLLGISKRSRNINADLIGSIWRLSRTAINLNSGDPLSGSWGTRGFFILPRVDVIRDGRRSLLLYDFPEQANLLIESGKLCTVDLHRMRSMRSPVSESLYLLLYDLAQWARCPSVSYPVSELAERTGMTISPVRVGERAYQRWGLIIKTLRNAAEEVLSFAQFMTDFSVEGKGADTIFTFFITDSSLRKGHLPR